ncbi:MAG: DUF4349 domain-containing protein [Candidatus Izemoplasmatales bacterium]
MKKLYWMLSLFIFSLLLISCSANIDDFPIEGGSDQIVLLSENVPERKIIYTVNSSFDVENLTQSIQTLRGLLNSDEWFDQETIESSRATFKARIKTERLDAFITDLNDNFQVRDFSKQATDVSLQYQDKTNRITAINLQIDRLQILYESASLSDMILINEQLAALEVELMQIQGELSLFDSLIDYSEVTIRLYGSDVVTKSPFFNRFANGIITGFKAVGSFFYWIGIAIAHIIPFAVVIGPIVIGFAILRKKVFLPRKAIRKVAQKDKE